MHRSDDSAAYAGNWRTVLAVDGGLGVAVSLVGVALVFLVNAFVGLTVIVVGAAYAALVASRARRWSRLRRSAPR